MSIKELINRALPSGALRAIGRIRANAQEFGLIGPSTKDTFSMIYERGTWGPFHDQSTPFYSGLGARDNIIVSTYVKAVRDFLSTFENKQNVVDLGCGDFFVGSQIRTWCGNYIACDIVPNLIEYNMKKYSALDVEFRQLDMIVDVLPNSDIVFLRQVLQHLSNRQIKKIMPKLYLSYKYLVLTEHLPGSSDFVPNIDKPVGHGIRLSSESGVVLTSPPFNIKFINQRQLCEVGAEGGRIVTTLFQLR